MLNNLFPSSADNRYQGHPLALWLFLPLTCITIVRSLIHIFRFDGGAQSIATIPLDSFTPAGSAAVITLFALWGLSQLLVGLLYLLTLIRYRTLLPLMYLSILLEYLGRVSIGLYKPLETLQTPPGSPFSFVMILLGAVLLVLSLWQQK